VVRAALVPRAAAQISKPIDSSDPIGVIGAMSPGEQVCGTKIRRVVESTLKRHVSNLHVSILHFFAP
jgi:hypothetical protein